MIGSRARSTLLASVVTGLVLTPPPVGAQEPGSRETRDFVQAAAQSDEFETLEAESVLAGSNDPSVEAFAREMIADHQRTNAALKAAVVRAGLKAPLPGIGGDQSMSLAALQSARGAQLDKTYAKQQILAHSAALAVLQVYASSGDDPSIRKFAASTVAIVRSHERMAEKLAGRLPNF